MSTVPAPRDTQELQELLWWIARATSPLVGEEFFRSLVANLGQGLGLSVVFVAECIDFPASRVRTLACWNRTAMHPDFEFDQRGTPCEETLREKRAFWVPESVHELYPAERGKKSESYWGVPIFDATAERVIGHLAFF